MFFIKTGLWALIAVGGLMTGVVSSIASVLWLWVISNLLVIVAGYFIVVNVHKGGRSVPSRRLLSGKPDCPFIWATV